MRRTQRAMYECKYCRCDRAVRVRRRWYESPLRWIGYKAYGCGNCAARFLSRSAVRMEAEARDAEVEAMRMKVTQA